MAHTPGPWVFEKLRAGTILAIQSGEIRLAEVVKWATVDPIAQSEREANANLLAAAPELLEALEAAIECGMVPNSTAKDGGATRHARQVVVADMIRDAVAKAKGLNPDQG